MEYSRPEHELVTHPVYKRRLFAGLRSTPPVRFAVVQNVAVHCLAFRIRNVLVSNLGPASDRLFVQIVV